MATLLIFVSSHSQAQGFRGNAGLGPPMAPPMAEPWTGPFAPLPPPQNRPRMETPQLLNDTPEYCGELQQTIERLRLQARTVPADVMLLADEGQKLCDIGHYRPGIMRLRTALMMLRRSN
jgi:hypothetical protein